MKHRCKTRIEPFGSLHQVITILIVEYLTANGEPFGKGWRCWQNRVVKSC